MASEGREISFGEVLRRSRIGAGLSQEGLAAAAGLSPRSISDLERGIHQRPRADTIRLLSDALRLSGTALADFEVAAKGGSVAAAWRQELADPPGAPDGVIGPGGLARSMAVTTPRLPHDIGTFTGRQPYLAQLMGAVARDGGVIGIYAIDGMPGVGKSAFAVHAAHLLASQFPDGQIFLSLHAHTAGHRPVEPIDALGSLLLTSGIPAQQIPAGLEDRSALWRAYLAGRRVLLLLDDAAGHEQLRPLLPGSPGSLVLITSRRNLSALDGATSICLHTLTLPEAADLLLRLADRPDIGPADPAISEVSELCGYLPLAISMLARQLHHHPSWTVADLARYLAAARDRLSLMHAENLSVAAAFDMSYGDLTAEQQRMFRRLGLHPGTDIDSLAAAALDDTSPATARHCLNILFDQHLVTEPASGRYRMHDLIREHARGLAQRSDPADNEAAIRRLTSYYVLATAVVGRYFSRGGAPAANTPFELPDPPSLEEATSWMEAERANIHAIVDLAAHRRWPDPGLAIAAAISNYLRIHGHWTTLRVLHGTARDMARAAGNLRGEIGALVSLSIALRLTGGYVESAKTLGLALELCADLEDRRSEASALIALGVVERLTLDFATAAATLSRALELHRESGDYLGEADALNELGLLRRLDGDLDGAWSSHSRALELYLAAGDRLGQAESLRYLGKVHQEQGDFAAAIARLSEALRLYRDQNDRLGQAHALKYRGSAERRSGDFATADATLTEALTHYRELGHPLGQAEVLNEIGELCRGFAPVRARRCHEQALEIARGIAVPLEEARALEGIGLSELRDDERLAGTRHLRQSREIYQRVGSLHAERVDQTLRRYGVLSPVISDQASGLRRQGHRGVEVGSRVGDGVVEMTE